MDLDRLRAAYEQVKGELLAERTEDGHWVGELSSSALSTATAVSALAVVRQVESRQVQSPKSKVQSHGALTDPTLDLGPWTLDSLICRGVAYLSSQQNLDGGFGDTDLSHSNIATTYLVVAALHLAGVADQHAELLAGANSYIDNKGRLAGLRDRYGIDKTFVVPIMTNLALAGLIDWREIDPLPFELACVPQSLYRFVGMPVVSYAIPALVAIGQARYFHAPPRNPITRLVRWLSITRSLNVLRGMQPDSGGYLEATPLTSFVVMSLASCSPLSRGPLAPRAEDQSNDVNTHDFRSRSERTTELANAVIRAGVKFLINSIRPDGSWPIDTNLATWNTTLAINALASAGEDVAELLGPKCLDWLLSCQHTKRHPFTGADPGGFGWCDLSGAVPDADDTPGAVLALVDSAQNFRGAIDYQINGSGSASLNVHQIVRIIRAVGLALKWLTSLQNGDGGWPTFCRGWGKLPFDRSGSDLTAHALRALESCSYGTIRREVRTVRIDLSRCAGLRFLRAQQHADGSWSPLWFGNQDHPQEDNPVYGTAKVLFAYRDLGLMDSPEAQRGVAWLVANQNADGGWGSGVWGKLRNADCGLRDGLQAEPRGKAGVESPRGVTGPAGTGHSDSGTEYSVLSTQYLVPGAQQDRPMSLSSPDSLSPSSRPPINPQSAIRNSQLTSSVEETALAVEALLAGLNPQPGALNPEPIAAAVEKGLTWLALRVERGEHRQPAPIGFYFAKLWYYERLYPLTFTVAALGRACRQFSGRQTDCPSIAHPASTGTTPWTTAAP